MMLNRLLTDTQSGFTRDVEENLFCCFSPGPCKRRWQVLAAQFQARRTQSGQMKIHASSLGNKFIHVSEVNPQCDSLPDKRIF